uniref:non-specific serine/threonine protein kinase n=1 Tax=Denticeps clupeoides TaxID=299321 RepID=A0AAY4E1D0_9TELE
MLNEEQQVQEEKHPQDQEVENVLIEERQFNEEKDPLICFTLLSTGPQDQLLDEDQHEQPVTVGRSLKFENPYEDYKILKCIGVGAFGKVHKARNLKTGHLVAIKIQDCTNDNLMDLLQECMLQERFNHQNIPKVMDKYYWEQKLYICMELCEGGDLDNIYMSTGSLKESQVAFVAKKVLETLLYLHQKGYVHRGIKPNNILLTDAGEVRLVDFGLMSRIQKEKPEFIVGTPAYMAPESVLEDLSGDYDERCDVWSLGIALLELAEGKLPLYWEQKQRVPHLRKMDKWSPAFHSFLKDALTVDPAMRPSVELLLQHEFMRNVEHEPSPLKRCLRRKSPATSTFLQKAETSLLPSSHCSTGGPLKVFSAATTLAPLFLNSPVGLCRKKRDVTWLGVSKSVRHV